MQPDKAIYTIGIRDMEQSRFLHTLDTQSLNCVVDIRKNTGGEAGEWASRNRIQDDLNSRTIIYHWVFTIGPAATWVGIARPVRRHGMLH